MFLIKKKTNLIPQYIFKLLILLIKLKTPKGVFFMLIIINKKSKKED
jgi:hypothetical protein